MRGRGLSPPSCPELTKSRHVCLLLPAGLLYFACLLLFFFLNINLLRVYLAMQALVAS